MLKFNHSLFEVTYNRNSCKCVLYVCIDEDDFKPLSTNLFVWVYVLRGITMGSANIVAENVSIGSTWFASTAASFDRL